MGTPEAMYNSSGEQTWSCDLDSYGRVRKHSGNLCDCPWRYQGQFEDEETGLYYNRFRYYDPNVGSYLSQDPIGLAGNNPTLYSYVSDPNNWVDVLGLHEILADSDLVARAGTCDAVRFETGSGVTIDSSGKLGGVSTQAAPGASKEILAQPYKQNQVGYATVGDIEAAGGTITLDGVLNSVDGKNVMNHATLDGLTPAQAEALFQPTELNPVPKEQRGISCNGK